MSSHSVVSLFDPVDCSTPGLPVLHHLPELAQTHVHWISDAIQTSYLLSSPSAPAFSLSQAPGSFPISWHFASGGQSIGASASASVLSKNIQSWFPLGLTGLIFLQSKRLSRIFSSITVQKHQFFGTQLVFLVQLSHLYVTTGKAIALSIWTFNLHFYLQEQPFVSGFAYFPHFYRHPLLQTTIVRTPVVAH